MLRSPLRFLLVFAFSILSAAMVGALPSRAHADEIAPELETLALHQTAHAALKELTSRLDAADKRRLTGIYVAFDPNVGDASAMAACDDDGDYVIVVSDAMLRLVTNVARALAYDEANGSRRIDEYAEFLARVQVPGRRLLPPPPGFFTAAKPAATFEDRQLDAFFFVLARELTHLRAGDLACPHPTATHERGDDEWSSKEQALATETSRSLYPGRATERDAEAIVRVLDAGRSVDGTLALLRFFERMEQEKTTHLATFSSTYLSLHPSSAMRAANVRAVAAERATTKIPR
ncbi:hypothetical protein AKJ09_10115 [Labilithrix luteola]|uniref:Peptidase M48 domain-containing protein n=1 Tax=Labilithrix luteola TaxID=1391654 RepID=A0A0K1QCR1_9BACT|nr:hypothetical protein [Labilithrix luteola]AKV03452.1 hypothetical protein AKJ09_10115 [Labilithrix luteola]